MKRVAIDHHAQAVVVNLSAAVRALRLRLYAMVRVVRRQLLQVPAAPDVISAPAAPSVAVTRRISSRLVEQAKARQALQIASPGACSSNPRTVSSRVTREA